jgi:transposase
MKRSRRNHSPAFKAKVALQASRGEKTLSELAQQHQAHATQIGAWKQPLLPRAAELFANGHSLAADSPERVQELHAKIGELTMERDFPPTRSSASPARAPSADRCRGQDADHD